MVKGLSSGKRYELMQEKESCAKLFGSMCYVCHKRFGKGFTFHHRWYTKGEAFYTDTNYHERIYKDVRRSPEQFLCLCVKCHYSLEKFKRYKPENFKRLIKAVNMSR